MIMRCSVRWLARHARPHQVSRVIVSDSNGDNIGFWSSGSGNTWPLIPGVSPGVTTPRHTNINKQFFMPNIQGRQHSNHWLTDWNINDSDTHHMNKSHLVSVYHLKFLNFQVSISFSDWVNYLFNWQMSLTEHLCDICECLWLLIFLSVDSCECALF